MRQNRQEGSRDMVIAGGSWRSGALRAVVRKGARCGTLPASVRLVESPQH